MCYPFFKKIIFLFFLFNYLQIKAQFFGLLNGNPEQYYSTALSQPFDNYYRVLNFRYTGSDGIFNRPQILVYDHNFQLADSINLLKGIYNVLNEPLKVGKKMFLPVTIADTISNSVSSQKLVVLEMDSTYHLINTHEISGYENNDVVASNLFYYSNSYYLGKSSGFSYSAPATIYKLNNQFSVIDSVILNNSWIQYIHLLNNNLLISGANMPSPCSGSGTPALMEMDLSFNTLNCQSITSFSIIENCYNIIPLSKTKYFIGGTNWPTFPNYHVLVNTIFDNNKQIIKSLEFNYPQKNTCYANYINFSAYQKNEIITTGIIDYDNNGLIENHNSSIFVNKIDTMGNLIWKKLYGGDLFYRPHSIVFTQDGGCLISGLRYDFVSPLNPGIMESFLLKLDANGNINSVGIMENGELNAASIKCFPNPASNQLQFDIPFQEDIKIVLYDITGTKVKSIENYQNLSRIDISELSPGVYTYQVKSKNNSYSGKWVKSEF